LRQWLILLKTNYELLIVIKRQEIVVDNYFISVIINLGIHYSKVCFISQLKLIISFGYRIDFIEK